MPDAQKSRGLRRKMLQEQHFCASRSVVTFTDRRGVNSNKSNAESGKGYGDILIWTPQRTGVVVELKYALDGDLEKSCEEALAQIESRGYDAEFKREGMKKIVKYGIAFYGKNCEVMMGRSVPSSQTL